MANNLPLSHIQEVLTSKYLKAAAPLDAKTRTDTIITRDAIPMSEREHGMEVFVREDSTKYTLSNPLDLTNTGWALSNNAPTAGKYLNQFDPANPPANPPTDGDDVNFNQGDFFQVSVAGIWNFPLGDQTVDGNEVNLTESDIIRYNIGSTWDVITFGGGDFWKISGTTSLQSGTTSIEGDSSGATNIVIESNSVGGGLSKFELSPDSRFRLNGGNGGLNTLIDLLGDFSSGIYSIEVTNGGNTKKFLFSPLVGFYGDGDYSSGVVANSFIQKVFADANYQPKATGTPDGTKFLGDNNSWQDLPNTIPAGTVTGAIQYRNAAGDDFDADDSIRKFGTGIRVGLNGQFIDFNPLGIGIWNNALDTKLINLTSNSDTEQYLIIGDDISPQIYLGTSDNVSFAYENFINNGKVLGIGTSLPNVKAQLDVVSTDKGALLPRMTTIQKDAMSLVGIDEGMELYDLTLGYKQIWKGASWAYIGETPIISELIDFKELVTYEYVLEQNYKITNVTSQPLTNVTIKLGGTNTNYVLGDTVAQWDRLDITVDKIGAVSIKGEKLGLPQFSTEAQLMLNSYSDNGNALTGSVRDAMVTFVDADVASGNYALRDYIIFNSSVLGQLSVLVDYLGNKIATNEGGVTFDIDGALYDGTTNLLLNFKPATDGTNYISNDAAISFFNFRNDNTTKQGASLIESGSGQTLILQDTASGALDYRIQTNIGTPTYLGDNSFIDTTLYSMERRASNLESLYKDGIQVQTGGSLHTTTPSPNSLSIGNTSYEGVITYMSAHASIGWDYGADNTNVRTLLTSLGITL